MPSTRIIPALPTSDLRSDSKATRRGKSQAAKWARGGRPAAGKQCIHNSASCGECVQRPAKLNVYTRLPRHEIREEPRTHHRQENIAKKVLQNDLVEVTQDSGSDEDVTLATYNEAPVPTAAEVVYSYDSRGPTDGQDILSNAVMQAVKRFENKQVEQLVKNEYDTLPDRREFEIEEETEAYAGDAEEEEYDIVDHRDLH